MLGLIKSCQSCLPYLRLTNVCNICRKQMHLMSITLILNFTFNIGFIGNNRYHKFTADLISLQAMQIKFLFRIRKLVSILIFQHLL